MEHGGRAMEEHKSDNYQATVSTSAKFSSGLFAYALILNLVIFLKNSKPWLSLSHMIVKCL